MGRQWVTVPQMRSHGAAGDSHSRRRRLPNDRGLRMRLLAAGAVLLLCASMLASAAPLGAAQAVTFERLWGQDRYETAVRIAEAYAAERASGDTVIIASGVAFADALSAAPLASVLSAPVLLTPPDRLPVAVHSFIAQHGITRAVIVGDEGAVSAAVAADLAGLTGSQPERISGADRDETNIRVARRVAQAGIGDYCGDGRRTVLLATREVFADALAISPLAYHGRHPVLLSDPHRLASGASAFLAESGVEQVIVVGGPAAVSAGVLDALGGLGIATRRWWGQDRYETAATVAQELTSTCFATAEVGLASGAAFPDALVGGALLGARRVPVVLADTTLPASTRQMLARTAAVAGNVSITVFGGPAAVREAVATAAVAVLRDTPDDSGSTSAPECTEPPPAPNEPISIEPPRDATGEVAPSEIVVEGRGHGHGNGMGQWGALGYATHYGCTGEQIALRFYGNTTLTDVDERDLFVHLTRNARHDLLVTSSSSFTAEGHSFSGGEIARLSVSNNAFHVHRTSGCADDPGVGVASGMAGRSGRNGDAFIEVLPSSNDYAADDRSQMLTMIYCGGTGDASEIMRITYRGALGIVKQSGRPYTFNRLPLEQYLRGVVAKESPPGWGARTGPAGTGLAALEAQAIAARSYALYWSQYQVGKGRFTDICDWPNCQLYEGAAAGHGSGVRRNDHGDGFEHSNMAIANTEGKALVTADGRFAFTEFSTSSGGWSAGPPASTFPAVPDLGDAVHADAGNSGHRWTIKLRRSDIEQAFEPLFAQQGKTLGRLVRIDVTGRDGNGEWGGRVRALRVVGTGGEHTFTFDRWARDPFRRAFPRTVLSDWYRFPQFDGDPDPVEPVSGTADVHLWVLKADGTVRAHGLARHYGDAGDAPPDDEADSRAYVDLAATRSGKGYWLLAASGEVEAFGDARHHGDAAGHVGDAATGTAPVGLTSHPDGGYWIALAGGEVLSFGAAASLGNAQRSDADALIVDIEATLSGGGLWLLAADGEILAFGDAMQAGSADTAAAVAIAAAPDGRGYWVADAGSAVHAFGSAEYLGSRSAEYLGSRSGAANRLASIDMVATDTGDGYWLIWSDGTSFNYGIAPDYPTSRAGPGVVAAASVR